MAVDPTDRPGGPIPPETRLQGVDGVPHAVGEGVAVSEVHGMVAPGFEPVAAVVLDLADLERAVRSGETITH